MYISTLASHLQLNSSIRSLQSQMMDAQKELSTGRKADLVAALRDRAAEDVDLRNALNDITEFKGTTEIVASRMDTMQAALGGVRDIADQMRNTALTSRDVGVAPLPAGGGVDRPRSHQLVPERPGRRPHPVLRHSDRPGADAGDDHRQRRDRIFAAAGGRPGHRQSRPDHRRGVGARRGQWPGRHQLDLRRHQQQRRTCATPRRSTTAPAPAR